MRSIVNTYGFFYLIFIFALSIIFLRSTHSYFTDSVSSSNNTFTAASVFPTPTPIPGIANHIVISEVQIDGGPGNADYDFIELYNPTSAAIDINGLRLVKRSGNSSTDVLIKSWTSQTIINAHGYYLWVNNSDSDFSLISQADTTTSVDLTNSNSIGLRNGPNDTGVLIDGVGWINGNTSFIEGSAFANVPGDNQGLERKALSTSDAAAMTAGSDISKGNGYDTNNNSIDFVLRTVSQPQNSGSATESP